MYEVRALQLRWRPNRSGNPESGCGHWLGEGHGMSCVRCGVSMLSGEAMQPCPKRGAR